MFTYPESFLVVLAPKFWGLEKSDSVPWYTELSWPLVKLLLLRRIYETILSQNISFTISGDKVLEILTISVDNVCRFL